jgi:hypothetical protein
MLEYPVSLQVLDKRSWEVIAVERSMQWSTARINSCCSFNNAAGTMQIKLFIFGFKPLLVAGNGAGQIT